MARPRAYRSEALVLKSTPFGEGALIVTLYARDSGKIRAVVRGARRPSSKMVGHLEPLNRVGLSLVSSRTGGMDTIAQAQILEGFGSLKSNLEAVSRGIYVAELVDGFGVEGNSNPELYLLLVDTLRFLDETPDVDLALRYFELRLLNCTGFMPQLYHCVECLGELSLGEHLFSPTVGGTLCRRCVPPGPRILPLSVQALKVLRFLDGTALSEITKLHVDGGLQDELKNILSVTLRYWLDREIQSRTFMDHLDNTQRNGAQIRGV